MKKPFQVGDRVTLYSFYGAQKGRVVRFAANGNLVLMLDELHKGNDTAEAHPKQCRRLVKKPRRRVWIDGSYNHLDYAGILGNERVNVVASHKPCPGWIEFVEVRRSNKEKTQ